MDIHELKKIVEERKLVILDIRDPDAYREAHIPEAIPLNDNNVEEFIKNTDKNAPILCYCYHGISSQSAVAFLKEQGFAEVHSLDGGFEAWRAAYPSTPEIS